MQLAKLVQHGGLGLTADLPPGTPTLLGVAQRYLAAPQPGTMPVALGVPAGTAMLE